MTLQNSGYDHSSVRLAGDFSPHIASVVSGKNPIHLRRKKLSRLLVLFLKNFHYYTFNFAPALDSSNNALKLIR